MKEPLVFKYVLPFIQWYALMILFALGIDYLLHHFNLVFIGIYLGYSGTTLILGSLLYSLRKRKIIQSGSPKKLLQLHEYGSWVGAVMVLVHAGIHFNALLPWLAILMLLITVASGLIGKYLLKKANETLKLRRSELIQSGLSVEETDNTSLRQKMQADTYSDGRKVYTLPAAFSLMIFYVLAMQCMSTLAVVKRETKSWKWPVFQFVYMTGLAYLMSFLVYQLLK